MRKKGISRALLTITMIILVLLAIALFWLIGNKLINKIFLGGP